jgi:hypothetical protein
MKAHLDFLFYTDFDGNPELHAIEVKSVSGIPDAPYPQWEDQLNFQLGLLRMQYPKGKVAGSILAVDLNAGQVHQFNGYKYNEAITPPDEKSCEYSQVSQEIASNFIAFHPKQHLQRSRLRSRFC